MWGPPKCGGPGPRPTRPTLKSVPVCRSGGSLNDISVADAPSLLNRIKSNVIDQFSITPNHYLYAGHAGWKHFSLLLNALLRDVENTCIEEVNTAYACILFKGHNKDKTSCSSYRTISTSPVVVKALDLHIRDFYLTNWNLHQPSTHFQGEGSSHELAEFLLTECIQHSLFELKEPLYTLYLDAKSAFDVVQKELTNRVWSRVVLTVLTVIKYMLGNNFTLQRDPSLV